MRKSIEIQQRFSEKWQDTNFEFCGVNWWPLIRCQVSFQTEYLNTQSVDDFNFEKFSDFNLPTTSYGKKAYLRYLKNRFKPISNDSNVAVFTVDSHITVPYQNKLINPFTYPFLKLFDKNEISYKVFQISSSEGFNYNNEIIERIYRKKVINKFNSNKRFQKDLLDFTIYLKNDISEKFDLYNLLVNSIVESQVKYLSFLVFFKKYNFKKVLVYCYYDSNVMAILRAANKLNITTIEYQHSQVSSKHFAYSGWGNSIQKSYSFFPSIIWAWRDSDVRNLLNEFSAIPSHKVIKGGNVVIPLYANEKDKKNNQIPKVLVALEGTGLPDYIFDFISNNKQVNWMLRLHPRYPSDKELILRLKNNNQLSVDIENANSLSLYELLKNVDYLLTSGSGCAIEAQTFGVTNIIYDEKGYTTYKEQIENGTYFFIRNSDNLKNIFNNNLRSNNDFDKVEVDTSNITKKIIEIFK